MKFNQMNQSGQHQKSYKNIMPSIIPSIKINLDSMDSARLRVSQQSMSLS